MVKQLEQCDQLPVYEVFLPTNEVVDVRLGKKTVKHKKIFPGYLWIRMDLYDADGQINEKAWYFVRNVQGVLGFLGGGNRPEPLSDRSAAADVGGVQDRAAGPDHRRAFYEFRGDGRTDRQRSLPPDGAGGDVQPFHAGRFGVLAGRIALIRRTVK